MSIKLMTMVWEIPMPTHAQKLILLKLADWAADDGGSVFPSRNTIADRCDVSVSTVKRTMGALRACGVIHMVREGGDGPKDTNEWRLSVPLVEALSGRRALLVGTAEVLDVTWPEDAENKGVTMDPLPEKGGHPGPLTDQKGVHPEQLRGPPTTNKGVTSGPQSVNNHQVVLPLAREGACDASAAPPPRESEGAYAAHRGLSSFTLTPADSAQWASWLEHVSPDERARMVAAGSIEVSRRWANLPGAKILHLAKSPQITSPRKDQSASYTDRMLGEGDE